MSEAVTIRARPETREQLRALATAHGESGVLTLQRLVNRAYDELLLAEMVAGMSDPTAAQEAAEWDGTTGDGLDDD